jgi:hypothetical protein
MKKIILLCLLGLGIFAASFTTHASAPSKVEVLFMNHGPLMGTINQLKNVFSSYGDKVIVSWYDFDTKEGEEFMAKKGIRQHVPLIIWIDGKPKWTVGVKEITFAGFPTGSGPAFFQGKWTMDDLKMALNQATGKK